jgi:hypothetical protein
MVFAGPPSAADRQNSRSSIFGRIWASRRSNFPRLLRCRRYYREILRTSRASAIGNDLDVFKPWRIRWLNDIRPEKTKCDKEAAHQTNPTRAFPFAGLHSGLTIQLLIEGAYSAILHIMPREREFPFVAFMSSPHLSQLSQMANPKAFARRNFAKEASVKACVPQPSASRRVAL